MNDQKWNAILAKNLIARHCAADGYVIERLKEIEAYLGTANLPSVIDEVKDSPFKKQEVTPQ